MMKVMADSMTYPRLGWNSTRKYIWGLRAGSQPPHADHLCQRVSVLTSPGEKGTRHYTNYLRHSQHNTKNTLLVHLTLLLLSQVLHNPFISPSACLIFVSSSHKHIHNTTCSPHTLNSLSGPPTHNYSTTSQPQSIYRQRIDSHYRLTFEYNISLSTSPTIYQIPRQS